MALDRPGDAASHFADAARRALVLDDAAALRDAGADETIAELAADRPAAALDAARRTRAALALRGAAPGGLLDTAEAAALHRLGREAAADARAAAAEDDPDAGVAERASFVRGLVAATRGDVPRLRAALARVAAPGRGKMAPVRAADAAELRGRLALLEGDAAAAGDAAARAASLRRATDDVDGLRRALALGSAAAARRGDGAAAAALAARLAGSAAAARPPD